MICIELKVTSCFLLPVGGNYLLVDTGYAYEFKDFLDKLHQKGIRIKDITYLLLTH
ncbi:MAG: MBL fold metallo-hydrolase [Desulfobacterales bacterium]